MRLVKLGVTVVAALTFAGMAPQAASAVTTHDNGTDTASVMRQVNKALSGQPAALTSGLASTGKNAAAGSVGGVKIAIPRSAAQEISITAPKSQLQFGLPSGSTASKGNNAGNGTVVYHNTNNQTDTIVQALPTGGVRALVDIHGKNAPTEFRFPVTLPAGANIHTTASGGLTITNDRGALLGTVAAPWAKDANDIAVPTSYSVTGNVITQRVKHQGAAYPVVADPEFHWWGIEIFTSSGEANRIAAAVAAGASVSAIVAIFAAGTIAGIPGAVVYGVAAGLLAIGSSIIQYCNANGRGIVITWFYVGGFQGCRSR